MFQKRFEFTTEGRTFLEITQPIQNYLQTLPVTMGLCHLFLQHTSAALLVTENHCKDVLLDLETYFSETVRDGHAKFRHRAEGDDDMSAHVRSVLSGIALTLPISEHRLALGTWQGLFLWEHRYQGRIRSVVVTVQGAEQ